MQVDEEYVAGFETGSVNYGTDIPHLKGHKGKRYLYGPGSILVAHGPDEGITKEELEGGVDGYKRLIMQVLRKEETDVQLLQKVV